MNLKISHATEGNLKDISLEIPRNQLSILTGVSGSGKSTLAVDLLFKECQRQYLEAMGLQGIQKPKVESITHLSPALLITQSDKNNNPRSTVGTQTNMYTALRMIYEKLGARFCPHCHKEYYGYQCEEQLIKHGDGFQVLHTCPHCDFVHPAITRSNFSPNTKEGACPKCSGMGTVYAINDTVLDESLTLKEGAITLWSGRYLDYQIDNFNLSLKSLGLPEITDIKLKDFSKDQLDLLKYGTDGDDFKKRYPDKKVPKSYKEGRFEGVYTLLWRKLSEKGMTKDLETSFDFVDCDLCHGTGLNEVSFSIHIHGTNLPSLEILPIKTLTQKVKDLISQFENSAQEIVRPYLEDIETKSKRLSKVGLDYLSLSRTWITLSGGEKQRIKVSSVLDSELTGVLYILDEPSTGLHPHDTKGMIDVIQSIRDKGNTVIVIEHDLDFIKASDYWIDMGPKAGKHGGEIVASGNIYDVLKDNRSITRNAYLKDPVLSKHRPIRDTLKLANLSLHNLKDITVHIPKNVLTSVVGVSGSGKSTLIFDVFLKSKQIHKSFNNIYEVRQEKTNPSKRSVVSTYLDILGDIRESFAMASQKKYSAKDFSFNVKGGRCERCEGLGYVSENRLFFEDIDIVCPVCQGTRFKDEILDIKVHNLSIHDVLNLEVDEATTIFDDPCLHLLQDVGLGYLTLGQTLPTLSGGEYQRLKLAKQLTNPSGNNNLYVLDEPSIGLHKNDVEHFMKLIQRLVDEGNTIVIVEHNTDIIRQSDYVIELGPQGGDEGGKLIFEGIMEDFLKSKTLTSHYL